MKGIVIEKNSENCVLLLSDGTFKTVKHTDDLEIGTILYINNTVRSAAFYLKKAAPMIAALFLVAFIGVGAYSWSIPAQYINIDINPSVELTINRYDRIIKMTPLNEDGEKLLESVDLQLKKYEKGVNAVIETARDLGYLQDEGDVLISISSSDSERREKTQTRIEEKVTPEAEVLLFDSKEHDQSVKEGLSPGKSKIISKVLESGTNLTEEELADAPVKELMLRVRENRKMDKELEKEAKQQEKLRKEIEKDGRKEDAAGNKNENKGNQDNNENKPENAGKEDDGTKGNDKTGNGKQEEKGNPGYIGENDSSEGNNENRKQGDGKEETDNGKQKENEKDKTDNNKREEQGNTNSIKENDPSKGSNGNTEQEDNEKDRIDNGKQDDKKNTDPIKGKDSSSGNNGNKKQENRENQGKGTDKNEKNGSYDTGENGENKDRERSDESNGNNSGSNGSGGNKD